MFLQMLLALPDFIEYENGRVIDCLVQFVFNAALIRSARLNESQEEFLKFLLRPFLRFRASDNNYLLIHHILPFGVKLPSFQMATSQASSSSLRPRRTGMPRFTSNSFIRSKLTRAKRVHIYSTRP